MGKRKFCLSCNGHGARFFCLTIRQTEAPSTMSKNKSRRDGSVTAGFLVMGKKTFILR